MRVKLITSANAISHELSLSDSYTSFIVSFGTSCVHFHFPSEVLQDR